MGVYKIWSILFVVCICGCKNQTTTINVQMDRDVKLLYSNPDIQICYDGFMDTLKANSTGKLKLIFNLDRGKIVILKTSDSKNNYFLPILPGENYNISLKNNVFLIDGPNKTGIELYQSVTHYTSTTMDWSMFKNDTLSRDEMIEKIKKKELAEFSQLLIANKITSSFYQLVSNDRDCFYAFVSSWLYSWDMLKIYRNEETDSSIMREKQTLNRLQKNFEHYYPDDIRLMGFRSWPFYGVFMYIQIYKSFYLKHVARNNIEGLLSSNLHFTFWFEQVKQSFPEEILESALAFLIHNQAVGDGLLIEASIPAFQYFKEKYPLSPYLKYFHQHIERVEALFSEEKPDTSIHFLENEPDLNTLSKLLTRFKGEKLYIDIWSPTCGPCRTEFQYCDSLEMILKQNNVTPLYISLDRGNKDAKQWKALVRYYNLKGYHFRAEQSFIEDLSKLYYEDDMKNTSFVIPWYIFVDENGHIVEKHFKRPSVIVSTKTLFN